MGKKAYRVGFDKRRTLAGAGVGLAQVTGIWAFDGAASIAVGLVLAVVALMLAWETRDLLIGESASPGDVAAIRRAVAGVPGVTSVGKVLTMHLAPDKILVAMEVEFADRLSIDQVEAAVDQVEERVRAVVPAAYKIFVEAQDAAVDASGKGRALADAE